MGEGRHQTATRLGTTGDSGGIHFRLRPEPSDRGR